MKIINWSSHSPKYCTSTMLWFVSLASLLVCSQAQFPPKPEGITTLESKFHPGITISYKEPKGVCETTPGVRSFSGYVHLPPNTIKDPFENQHYPINTFFWFFEARNNPHNAPLAIWLNGGPGGSSLIGALHENGPCFVNDDSNSTRLNPYSWNNNVNMLYIDEPVQVGFSYDVLQNITANLAAAYLESEEDSSIIQPVNFTDSVPEQNATFYVGTMGSQKVSHTANSTHHAAIALWHFAQTWFEEFPAYKPDDERITLFAESYGGKYGPGFVSYFVEQNEKIDKGELSGPGVHYLHMDTLGIVNGCIDDLYTAPSYTEFAYRNTYGIQAINETEYHREKFEIHRFNGTLDKIRACQTAARTLDPDAHGDIQRVIDVCHEAGIHSTRATMGAYMSSNHGVYDITHPRSDPFPGAYMNGYLNQHWVQKELGVPVNFSSISSAVSDAFEATGDFDKGGMVENIAYVLDHGVKVALMYGDRDWICNWIGGEETAKQIPYSHQADFLSAGYQPIAVNPFYSGGQVKQYGNFSFARVYQAGHMVPAYQPEASLAIFERAVFNKDIATGTVDLLKDTAYKTKGPDNTWHILNEVLPSPEPICYVFSPDTCTKDEWKSVVDGTAVIKDWKLVKSGDKHHSKSMSKTQCNEHQPKLMVKTQDGPNKFDL